MARFQQMLAELQANYCGIAVSLPPETPPPDISTIEAMIGGSVVVTRDWTRGRHAAIQKALEHPWSHVHYADMDRLLHWVETEPGGWRRTVAAIRETDCLIIGRTERAWQTHPQAMRQTEAIINAVVSHLLGQSVDTGAGSKGFSRRAAEFLLENSPPGHALGTDTEWPVLLHRAGCDVRGVRVNGLTWEHADHYSDHVAGPDAQRQLAATYDGNPQNWAKRVQVALEIVQAGLAASRQVIRRIPPHDR